MTVTPTGLPYWARSAGFGQYGGNENKRNHLLQGAVDPETDVTAEQCARMSTDLASLARVAPFAVLRVKCNDSSPAAPTIQTALLATGVNLVGYEGDSAPSGFPSAARVGNGECTITFDNSYSDDYGITAAFSVGSISASANGNNSGALAVTTRDSDTQITVEIDDSFGAVQNAEFTVTIYSGGA